jgi:hypothetical protein
MRPIRFLRFASFALVVAAMLGACSSTNLTNMWMDQGATSPVVDNILVISLDRNPEMRRLWEDALSAEFQAQGLVARPQCIVPGRPARFATGRVGDDTR